MTIHCFELYYAPSAEMDKIVSNVLDQVDEWSQESLEYPTDKVFVDIDAGTEINASGFSGNRFEWIDKNQDPRTDAEEALKDIVNNISKVNDITDWWIIRWHECYHDEDKPCGEWAVIDSSNNYSGQTDVPSEVPQ